MNTACFERVGYYLHRNLNKLWVKRTFAAAMKRAGYVGPRKRLPLTTDILARLKPLIDFSKNDDRALWAILCVGVFTLARIGEMVPGSGSKLKFTLNSLTMRHNKGSIFLVGTKTDVARKGMRLLFFRNNSVCCPYTAMNAYLSARPLTRSDAPLFVNSVGKSFTQRWVVSRLRALISKIGLEGADFSGISLRRGGAHTLLRQQANDTVIMTMGRWTSSCFNRYLSCSDGDIER
jgi:hypothetical protein